MTEQNLYHLSTDEMVDPIERLFEREFAAHIALFRPLKPTQDAELAYISGSRDKLHLVVLESSYRDALCNIERGLHLSSRLDANYRWLALPLDVFRSGESNFHDMLVELADERGVGLICVQPSGAGLSAKVIHSSKHHEGIFLDQYPILEKSWLELSPGPFYEVISL